MGRQIYLTDKEINALIDAAVEWCDIMGSGEETIECTEERLENGLGSALYKLYKGRNGEKVYANYVNK